MTLNRQSISGEKWGPVECEKVASGVQMIRLFFGIHCHSIPRIRLFHRCDNVLLIYAFFLKSRQVSDRKN